MEAVGFFFFSISKEAVLLFKGNKCVRDLNLAFKSLDRAEVVPKIQETD